MNTFLLSEANTADQYMSFFANYSPILKRVTEVKEQLLSSSEVMRGGRPVISHNSLLLNTFCSNRANWFSWGAGSTPPVPQQFAVSAQHLRERKGPAGCPRRCIVYTPST